MLNRIIGILVMLAIGILIYPVVFTPYNGFPGHAENIKAPAFPSPQTQNDTIKALSKSEENSTNKVKMTTLITNKQKKLAVKFTAPVLKEKKHSKLSFKNVAWVIHVGTYNDKVDALSLVNQLRSKGYNAFIHQTNAAFGEDVQVYIGPELKKESAASLAAKLAKETQLSGVIKTYHMLSV